ncbi:hypothetical protein SELMODRAFT_413685 [Selaginella moellendorffii]|uniref:DDE Tnp4 domain-containing protein n=1 Tax=Selaginella moellendorffii TaxID=88036 RepID=D8RPW4_SELML|nr:hypothetical protein SELMODRAFT_413685 [Selaginella moellendorffii]
MQLWFHNLEEQDDVTVEQEVEEDDGGDEEEGNDCKEGEASVYVVKKRKTENPDYFSLSHKDAKWLMPVKLNLKVFLFEYFNIMDEFLAKQAPTSPTFLNLAWQKESIVCMKENSLAEKEKVAAATILTRAISNLASSISNFLNGAASRNLATVQPQKIEDASRENQRDAGEERGSFNNQAAVIDALLRNKDTKFRRVVLVDVRMGVILYNLFKNTDYSDLSDKFGIGEAIAHDIVVQTTVAIIKCLRLPGSVHDVRVFWNSKLCSRVPQGQPTIAALDDPSLRCLDKKQRIKLKYLSNIIKGCCILHNFLIDAGETNINAEIKAWERHIQALKKAKIFEDYEDPIMAEGEP